MLRNRQTTPHYRAGGLSQSLKQACALKSAEMAERLRDASYICFE